MRKILADHFKNYKYLSNIQISDSHIVSFILSYADVKENKYFSDIYILTDYKEAKKITSVGEISNYSWIDRETILFQAVLQKDDKVNIEQGVPLSVFYKLDIVSGCIKEALRINKKVEGISPIDKNRYLILCVYNPIEEKLILKAKGDWNKFIDLKRQEDNYLIAEEVPFWTNSEGWYNKIRRRLYIYENGTIRPITSETTNVLDFKVYKDKYAIYYAQDFENVLQSESKLYYINLSSLSAYEIGEENDYIYTYVLPVNINEIIVARNDRKIHGEYQDETIEKINLNSGRIDKINENFEYHLFNDICTDISYGNDFIIDFHSDGNGVYFLSTIDDSCYILYADFNTQKVEKITEKDEVVLDFKIKDNIAYMIAMKGLGGAEIYMLDLSKNEKKVLTDFNSHLVREYDVSLPEKISFINSDNIEIFGWVMKPANFNKNKKYPAILFIHGGPNTAYSSCFFHEMQFLANEGYGIMFCNPRGSIGRGGDFADIRNKYGSIDYNDIMEFTDIVLNKYKWIDINRLGITGGSYGGLMTNWIIGHTNLFKAAVSDRGVSNNICDFFLSEIGFSCGIDTYGVTPWDSIEKLWNFSPIKYALRIKTPTLFIHGESDFICNKEQSLQMFSALKYFGIPSKAFIIKNENHDLSREGAPQNRIRRLNEIKDWFDKYLKYNI